MNIAQVLIIYRKEMTEVLRDRRTLLSMILIPILIFPVMTIGLGSLMGSQMEKIKAGTFVVAIIGGENSPELVTHLSEVENFQLMESRIDIDTAKELLTDKAVQVVVDIPQGFESQLYAFFNGSKEAPQVEILSDESEVESEIAGDRVAMVIKDYRRLAVSAELERRNIRGDITKPFLVNQINTASERKMGGFILGMILPYMVIMLSLIGALYPAIDLTAGEKERGTLETLLVSPAGRMEIVVGKFITVMTASLVTAMLAIVSMTITFTSGFMFGGAMGEGINLGFDFMSIVWVLLMMIPMTATFSALLLTIALFAKSYKEAQSYTTPLMILVIMPSMITLIPGVEPSAKLAMIPVVNVAMMLKQALMGHYEPSLISITIIASLVYAAGAMFIAFRQFQREEVLFRV